MKPVRTATFDGIVYEIIVQELDGLVSGKGDRVVLINRNLDTRVGLTTLLHECLHASGWAKSEKVVERTAREAANLLWRLGVRIK